MNCVEDSFTQNMLKIIVYSVEKEAKIQCKSRDHPTKRQQRLIDSARCSNGVKNAHHKCTQRAIKYIVDSIDMKDNHKKLGYICW